MTWASARGTHPCTRSAGRADRTARRGPRCGQAGPSSVFWLSRTGLRTVATRLRAPHGEVVVFGTVLPWHSDRGDTPSEVPPRNWEEHHRVVSRQGAEWARLRSAHPDADLCAMGGFNTGIAAGYGTRQGKALVAEAPGQG
jgi:hypothetical protein